MGCGFYACRDHRDQVRVLAIYEQERINLQRQKRFEEKAQRFFRHLIHQEHVKIDNAIMKAVEREKAAALREAEATTKAMKAVEDAITRANVREKTALEREIQAVNIVHYEECKAGVRFALVVFLMVSSAFLFGVMIGKFHINC